MYCPLAFLLLITFFPPTVDILFKKPCFLILLTFLGCQVRVNAVNPLLVVYMVMFCASLHFLFFVRQKPVKLFLEKDSPRFHGTTKECDTGSQSTGVSTPS